jgi:hypothetical protein
MSARFASCSETDMFFPEVYFLVVCNTGVVARQRQY